MEYDNEIGMYIADIKEYDGELPVLPREGYYGQVIQETDTLNYLIDITFTTKESWLQTVYEHRVIEKRSWEFLFHYNIINLLCIERDGKANTYMEYLTGYKT